MSPASVLKVAYASHSWLDADATALEAAPPPVLVSVESFEEHPPARSARATTTAGAMRRAAERVMRAS
jgi:hypothetical protein